MKNFSKPDFTSKSYFFIFFKRKQKMFNSISLYVSDINFNGRKNTGYISHVFDSIKVIKYGYNSVFKKNISQNFNLRHEH